MPKYLILDDLTREKIDESNFLDLNNQLLPILLKDGTWIISEDVLLDKNTWKYQISNLQNLSSQDIPNNKFYKEFKNEKEEKDVKDIYETEKTRLKKIKEEKDKNKPPVIPKPPIMPFVPDPIVKKNLFNMLRLKMSAK